LGKHPTIFSGETVQNRCSFSRNGQQSAGKTEMLEHRMSLRDLRLTASKSGGKTEMLETSMFKNIASKSGRKTEMLELSNETAVDRDVTASDGVYVRWAAPR